MKHVLKISKEINLPIDAVTQTFAFIGRKGAGKTYLASMVAEQMLDQSSQIVIIDPVGNWWGLRVGADGKSKGKEIFVIGGDHGDIPLIPEAGAKIAKLIVEKNISAVLDVSSFRIGEHKRFAAEFAEEFFHLKKAHRSPIHMFIEEAQKLIPQRVGPDEARMVGAFEQIVRLGRNYGIGCSLVTQRPQSVNKEVLSQVECLCVLQVTGPHERKALEEWVQEAGADRKLIGQLPGLERGEGYVWSPAWLRIFERVHFSKKETFDASATPVVGQKTKQASLSAVDVESIKKDMAEVIEQATKDDPKTLRKRIVELEREVKNLPHKFDVKQTYIPEPKIIDSLVGKAVELERAASREVENAYKEKIKEWKIFCEAIINSVQMVVGPLHITKGPKDLVNVYKTDYKKILSQGLTPKGVVLKFEPVVFPAPRNMIESSEKLGMCEKKIYSFLMQQPNRKFTKTQIGIATLYSPNSGGFNNALGKLNTLGMIVREGTMIQAGAQGGEVVDVPDRFMETWVTKLGKCEGEILSALMSHPHDSFTKEEVATMTVSQYSSTSGGFNNSIGALNSLGLTIRENSHLRINPELLEI